VNTQPNPRRGIMVTFEIVSSIARADATICICFIDGAVANRLVVLDCREEGYESGERLLRKGPGEERKC
jgi:hypothetical protein